MCYIMDQGDNRNRKHSLDNENAILYVTAIQADFILTLKIIDLFLPPALFTYILDARVKEKD